VFDTNVLISASLLKNSTPRLALDLAARSGRLCFSSETLAELRIALARPKLDRYISQSLRLEFARTIAEQAHFVTPATVPAVCRDADDNQVLAVAVAARAACVCSGDQDLLSLAQYEAIPILTPAQFVERFGHES
jgi:putative PIN family toxin of toxin-antitoxin system